MTTVAFSTSSRIDYAIKHITHCAVHVSSISVHGEIQEQVVVASTPIRYPGPYGVAKFSAEYFPQHRQAELPAVCVRCPTIVGHRSHHNFLAVVFRSMQQQSPLVLVSNPSSLFNNVIHEDILATFLVQPATTARGDLQRFRFVQVIPCRFKRLLNKSAASRTSVVKLNGYILKLNLLQFLRPKPVRSGFVRLLRLKHWRGGHKV